MPRHIAFLLVLLHFTSPIALRSQDADTILQSARMNPTSHSATLRAQIRGETGPSPLTISLKDGIIRYEFTHPDQTISLSLTPSETKLSEKTDGITTLVSPAHQHDQIRKTGITYQDLSLGFLYWPHPVLQGDDTFKTRSAWKIDLQAPSDEPLYGVARVWIDKESGAILKIEGFDKKGLLLRRFEVISGQQIDGFWTLKQMRIESFSPGNSHDVLSRNYLEILGKQ
jgi:hypothetical protein